MPILELDCIELSDGRIGIDPLAFLNVLSVMLFPCDSEMQEWWRATQSLEFAYDEETDPASFGQLRQMDIHALLRHQEDPESLKKQVSEAIWRGGMAGDILLLIASMAHEGLEGSIRKAGHILLEVDYKPGVSSGGDAIPRNDTSLRHAWRLYQSVAHLWAAWRHNQRQIMPHPHTREGEPFSDDTHIHPGPAEFCPICWLSLQDEDELDADDLTAGAWKEACWLQRLALAEGYRTFGLNYCSPPQHTPLLANTDLWVIQTRTVPPWPGSVPGVPWLALSQSQRDALARYKAKPDR